jgi:D-alanine-D-alanine ligase
VSSGHLSRVLVVHNRDYEGADADPENRARADVLSTAEGVRAALLRLGHPVELLGIGGDLDGLTGAIAAAAPDVVFNLCESLSGEARFEPLLPMLLERAGIAYTGSPPLALLVSRNKAMSKKVLAYHGIRVPGFATYRPGEAPVVPAGLRFPLIVKPLQSDASAGIAQASVVQDPASLADRVAMVHERFDQPAIAEEFVDGRELYVSMIGNGDALEILPITEMVFDKRRTKPEERIATEFAKWDEDYRGRKGIRNVFARPLARAARERIAEICRTAFRALWLRDYARLDVRLAPDGEIWFLEANANPFISYGHDMANAAEKAGMDYYRFIQRLVDEAAARYEHA